MRSPLCTWLELRILHCPCCDLKSELVTRCTLYPEVFRAVKREGGKESFLVSISLEVRELLGTSCWCHIILRALRP